MNPESEKDPAIILSKEDPSQVNDFGKYFHRYGIDYSIEAPWLVVGEIDFDKKWVLFLSVLPWDVKPLLEKILPVLFIQKIPFRVVQNYEYIQRMNGMWYGIYEVGKVITICPPDEKSAVKIAKDLALLTSEFKGPLVHEALRLGAILFANFCEMVVDQSNEVTEFVRNYVPAKSKVPFKISRKYRIRRRKGIIGKYYVPMKLLRPNSKGDISWGVNMKNWAFTPCVIKQARGYSFYDSLGREPMHKLIWQKAVLEDIQHEVSVPKLIDFCKKKDDYYLIMEFIEGNTLHEEVKSIYNGVTWSELNDDSRKSLLILYRDALIIVNSLHTKGYVHRDITDANFVISQDRKMYLLDFELTCSITKGLPDPPHGLGTLGYVSPEQKESAKPTFKEDLYSLGALLLSILTGRHPQEVIGDNETILAGKVASLIEHAGFRKIILESLDTDPLKRPDISQIRVIVDIEIEKYEIKDRTDQKAKKVLYEASLIK